MTPPCSAGPIVANRLALFSKAALSELAMP
jgi:hypothetical protein